MPTFVAETPKGSHRVKASSAEAAAKKVSRIDKAADIVTVTDIDTDECVSFHTSSWTQKGSGSSGGRRKFTSHRKSGERGEVRADWRMVDEYQN